MSDNAPIRKEIKQSEQQGRQVHAEIRSSSIKMVRELASKGERQALADLLTQTGVPTAIRRAAAKALSEIASLEQVPAFTNALLIEPDRGIRLSVIRGLGRLADDNALSVLVTALKDKEAVVRLEAAHALSRYNSQAAFDSLLTALQQNGNERNRFMRQYAAEALGQLGDRRAVPNLIEALRDESELVRPAVAIAFGNLGQAVAIPLLTRIALIAPSVKQLMQLWLTSLLNLKTPFSPKFGHHPLYNNERAKYIDMLKFALPKAVST